MSSSGALRYDPRPLRPWGKTGRTLARIFVAGSAAKTRFFAVSVAWRLGPQPSRLVFVWGPSPLVSFSFGAPALSSRFVWGPSPLVSFSFGAPAPNALLVGGVR